MASGWKKVSLILLILCLFGVSPAAAMNRILGVRHWVAPDHTRVVIDLSDSPRYHVARQEGQLNVDLQETELPADLAGEIAVQKPHLEAIRLSAQEGGARVALSLPVAAQTKAFSLPPYQDKPHRIVIDIVQPEAARQQSEERGRIRILRKNRIVVIDPGHGGEAVGAVGKGGSLEKDVVLAIARRLRDLLNRREGYRAFLTREGDYYVSFRDRVTIAREYGADLFLSIHADAARNGNAAGASVYSLSTGGASSEAAKILARNENLADVLGGVPNGESNDASDAIILDMFQTHTRNQSRSFGTTLLRHLEGVNRVKFSSVQEAPFRVLKMPQIPSVLVETAFISNRREEKLLNSSDFQDKIAAALATAVADFLPPLPPVAQVVREGEGAEGERVSGTGKAKKGPGNGERPAKVAQASAVSAPEPRRDVPKGPLPASPERPGPRPIYRVQPGDTLGKIAARQGTTIAVLLRLNGMKLSDPLYAGRQLLLPVQVPAKGEGKSPVAKTSVPVEGQRRYVVRKGDSLEMVARREGTTVKVLCELNRIKAKDPLFVGRVLKLPGDATR